MKLFKLLILKFLIVLSVHSYSQNTVTVEFTELYLRDQGSLGYVIHTVEGKVIHYDKFDKRARKKGLTSQCKAGDLDSLIITIVGRNSNFSYYPVKNFMRFHPEDNYPYSVNLAYRLYSIDFSEVEDERIRLGAITPSRMDEKYVGENITQTYYNFFHPLFFPYNIMKSDEYNFFTYKPLHNLKDRSSVQLMDQDVFTSNRFVDLELPDEDVYQCDILLFVNTNIPPYLLHSKGYYGQLSLSIPVPEQLEVERIGVVSRSKNMEVYSEFMDFRSTIIQDVSDLDHNIDFEISQNVIQIPDKDVDAFHLIFESYDSDKDKQHYWIVNGLNRGGFSMKFPIIPEIILENKELNSVFLNPESVKFYAIRARTAIDFSNVDIYEVFDLYWRIENEVVINKFYQVW